MRWVLVGLPFAAIVLFGTIGGVAWWMASGKENGTSASTQDATRPLTAAERSRWEVARKRATSSYQLACLQKGIGIGSEFRWTYRQAKPGATSYHWDLADVVAGPFQTYVSVDSAKEQAARETTDLHVRCAVVLDLFSQAEPRAVIWVDDEHGPRESANPPTPEIGSSLEAFLRKIQRNIRDD